ncbi:hypothetical protein [Mycolicibacterium sp.]|uniref:hypothetical protein n=1 Tax=Mycolicibacterium sp. TaxID=2320850 RepID=UPI003D130454
MWSSSREGRVGRVAVFGVLPVLALMLAPGVGWLKWQAVQAHALQSAGAESVRAATDGTTALLTYRADTVETDLAAARDLMTGAFLDSFTSLAADVVIPGAKEQKISSTATVTAAASVTATTDHAVVLVFVDQTTAVAGAPPTKTASTVKVTLDKVVGRWLMSEFAPL